MEYINSFDASLFSTLLEPPMAHVSATIGHHILLIGGYRISYENDLRTITAFDKHDVLIYDVINHELSTLEVKYDNASIGSFPPEFFFSSGMACATVGNRVYLFGGYSLSKLEAGNALYYVELKRVTKLVGVGHLSNEKVDVGLLSDGKISAQLVFLAGSYEDSSIEDHARHPSYRDKASMVHWGDQLVVFGGYGCHFRGSGPEEHDFLMGTLGDYVVGSSNRGWTNQLLVFSLIMRRWTSPTTNGSAPCPRAAHSAAVSGHRMFIFGGRLGVRNTAATIRCNQLYHLDLTTFCWSQVRLDDNGLVGRSWTSFTPLGDRGFFIVGGFSGDNVPLADAHVISLDESCKQGSISTKTLCMERALWDPCMDYHSWGDSSHEPVCRMWHSTSLAPDGRIYIFGGCQNNLIFEIEKIQTVVERVRASPHTLYTMCLWKIVTSRSVLPSLSISTAIMDDIILMTL